MRLGFGLSGLVTRLILSGGAQSRCSWPGPPLRLAISSIMSWLYNGRFNPFLGRGTNGGRSIVGRDTEEMSESDIVRATVETIAESTADGIMAPLSIWLLGGSVGACL